MNCCREYVYPLAKRKEGKSLKRKKRKLHKKPYVDRASDSPRLKNDLWSLVWMG